MTFGRKKLVVGAVAAGAIVAGGAVAAWSTSSSGNGSAKAATASPITLSDASASTTGDLYPGASGDLMLKVSNPNPFPVRITAVTGNGTITSDTAGCTSATHGVTLTDQTGLALDVAASASNTVLTVAGAVHMSSSTADACQGAVFTIPVGVTAASN